MTPGLSRRCHCHKQSREIHMRATISRTVGARRTRPGAWRKHCACAVGIISVLECSAHHSSFLARQSLSIASSQQVICLAVLYLSTSIAQHLFILTGRLLTTYYYRFLAHQLHSIALSQQADRLAPLHLSASIVQHRSILARRSLSSAPSQRVNRLVYVHLSTPQMFAARQSLSMCVSQHCNRLGPAMAKHGHCSNRL